MANRGGFSWKRATGVTKLKRDISKATGVPLTKSGRQRKVGRMMTGGGCLIPTLIPIILLALVFFLASCGVVTLTESNSDSDSKNDAINTDQTIESNESTSHTMTESNPMELQTTAGETETGSTEYQTTAGETEVDSTENRTTADETETGSTENQATAGETEVDSTENQTAAEETEIDSTENQTTAEEVEIESTENQTTAEEAEIDSTENQTAADETEANPPEDSTSQPSISLVSITSPISINETATLTIKGSPNAEYSIDVFYSSGASSASGLEKKFSDDSGFVSWSWKIGARVKSGKYRIVVKGGGLEYTTYFIVQ